MNPNCPVVPAVRGSNNFCFFLFIYLWHIITCQSHNIVHQDSLFGKFHINRTRVIMLSFHFFNEYNFHCHSVFWTARLTVT